MSRFPPRGPRRVASSPASAGTINTLRFPAVPLASLRFLRSAIPRATHGWFRVFRRCRVSNDGPGVGHPVLRPGIASVETTGSPKFLGNPNVHLHMFFDPGRTDGSSPKWNARTVPAKKRTKTPTHNPISRLNSMAFGLAVYASQCRLPKHHARLASGCRLRSAGWASAHTGFR
jgi:hypothetical protein